MRKPNIVIIVVEQWRGDLTGYAGHTAIKTPTVDRLAEEAVAFARAYSTSPICTPSRCSIMTGWYPHTRGHRTQRYLVGPDEPNLLRALKRAGYRTAMLGKNDVLHHSVVGESLDLAGPPPKRRGSTVPRRSNPHDPDDPRYYTFLWGPEEFPPDQHPDAITTDRTLAFVDAVKDEAPFCAWVNFSLAHPPYRVEEPWWSMYDGHDVGPLAVDYEGKPSFVGLLREAHRMDDLPSGVFREIRSRYMAMISRADELIGRVIAGLRTRGLWESTALFVVSDHGNYGGDYGIPAKWWTGMEDALLRVPLLVRVPGQCAAGVSTTLVQHFDLNQTTLDLAGVERDEPTSSRSLLPYLQGSTDQHRDCVIASGGHWYGQENPLDLDRSVFVTLEDTKHLYYPWKKVIAEHPEASCRTFAVRDGRWKYVWRSTDRDELYDTESDPLEERNLYDSVTGGHASSRPRGTGRQDADGRSEASVALVTLRDRLMHEVFTSVDVVPRIYPDEPGSISFAPHDPFSIETPDR